MSCKLLVPEFVRVVDWFDLPSPPKSSSFVETRSRRTDCDTSKAAAKAAVSCDADRQRAAIVATVKSASAGFTAREVSQLCGISYYTVQRRISECGLTKTKKRRDGCAVWEAVQ